MLSLPNCLTHDVDVQAELARLMQASPDAGVVQVDASTLEKMDSTSMALLLEWQRRLAQRGQWLHLVHPTPALSSLMLVYGASDLIEASTTAS